MQETSARRRSLPADARRSLLVYNLFFPLVFLFLLPGFLARMLKRGGAIKHFAQRFGRYTSDEKEKFGGGRLWIQSISVGETLIALKLVQMLRELAPETELLLSTTTSTGFALAEDASDEWLAPIYNPIDFKPFVRNAVDALRPARLALIEGGVWPNLVAECYLRGIPVDLVCARLSPRSASRFRRFKFWTGPIFRLMESVAVSDPGDVERWVSLGVPKERICLTGNVKFDPPLVEGQSRAEEFRALAAAVGVRRNTPVLLGGSTFEGEERVLAELLAPLRRDVPELRLILAPRHVERVPSILRDLAPLGYRVVRRTTLPSLDDEPADIVLIDTTGELRDWYHVATVVFIGKSIAAVGGQNPAEAIMAGKPVVFGPHMENFAALTTHLMRSGAAVQVAGARELEGAIRGLLLNPAKREELVSRSRSALDPHRGATRRSAKLLLQGAGE